ncbi:trypsin-like serine protease [Streptomyces sp. NPDC101118]|uniref:trypsin-like serine protease n=1 Tax=Streptomyces sp. NPDC101118 TaxID=3366109 RepID=UPI003827EFFB
MKPLHSATTPIRVAVGAALLSAPLTLGALAGTASAVVGTPAAAGSLAHTARLSVGEWPSDRGCAATVVDEIWLATATSCFATVPGATVPAGQPAVKTTATLSDGRTVRITEVVPRTDRDLALVRLAEPTAIKPVTLAAAAPAANAEVKAAGFGRTKTEWVPDKLHTGAFTVNASDTTTLTLTGKGTDALCKGDTGGPLLNASGQLVGVNSRSWQGGCLGAPATETRTGAISSRADGLGSWISSVKARPTLLKAGQTLQSGETISSENARLVMQADGNLVLYHRTGGQGKGGALWASGTGGNEGAFARMQDDGNFVVYKKGSTGTEPAGALWSTGTHQYAGARVELQADANLVVYTKDGGHGIGGHLWHSDTYPRGNKLASGAKLMPGSWLTNGTHVLLMDIQGNVHLREQATSRELWSKITWDWYAYLNMKADGSLVLSKKDGTTLWTAFGGGAGSTATLDGGSLVGNWGDGGTRWASASLRGEGSGRCLDFNGATATIYDCWGGANQRWDYTPAKELRTSGNQCLTAEAGANQSAKVGTALCDGRAEQKWNFDGETITAHLNPGQCMNVWGQATANGSQLGLWQCNGGSNTKWKRP